MHLSARPSGTRSPRSTRSAEPIRARSQLRPRRPAVQYAFGVRRAPRSAERGTAMVVMLIVLVALGTIAGLTVISVQGGSATANAQRFDGIALYAAESGAAAAF